MGAQRTLGTGVLCDSPKAIGLGAASWQSKDLNPEPPITSSGLFAFPNPTCFSQVTCELFPMTLVKAFPSDGSNGETAEGGNREELVSLREGDQRLRARGPQEGKDSISALRNLTLWLERCSGLACGCLAQVPLKATSAHL